MKQQFDKGVNHPPRWDMGDQFWSSGKTTSMTRQARKLDHRWLWPFAICQQVSMSAYKLTLTLSIKGVHLVFHVSVLKKYIPDSIEGRKKQPINHMELNGKEEWEVDTICNCRKKKKKTSFNNLLDGKDLGLNVIYGKHKRTRRKKGKC